MYYFSYNDYMDYTNNKKNNEFNKINKLEEESEEYIKTYSSSVIEKSEVIELIKNKEKIIKFINKYLSLSEKIKINDLNYCNDLISKEKDSFLYKIRKREIYIFTKIIDYKEVNLSYKILNVAVKIIETWNKQNVKKFLRYPIVIPIVVNMSENIKDKDNENLKQITYKNNGMYFYYNLINVNTFIKMLS